MNPFESIDLDDSVAATPAHHLESSLDDGLDPNDFLSQGGHPDPASPQHLHASDHHTPGHTTGDTRGHTPGSTPGHTPDHSTQIPTLLRSEDLHTSAVFESMHSSMFNLESFSPSHVDQVQAAHTESTIKYLRNRYDRFASELDAAVALHKKFSEAGDDCSDARTGVVGLFNQLSENCLAQCEMYTRELAYTQHSLAYFQKLDRQRLKVLRRIKHIKSDKNEFGAKLDSLLAQRSGIDTEIATLETRLEALRAKQSTVDVEINGTISVLESKSAKYVNYFRHLETSAKAAILDYLGTGSGSPQSIATYLKTEKVAAAFSSTNHCITAAAAPAHEDNLSSIEQESSHKLSPKAADMGMQALEIPADVSAVAYKKPNDAYDKGFDTASKQLETLKKGVSNLVHALKNASNEAPAKTAAPRKLDDSLNTISEKLDFSPMFQLFTSKIDTLKHFEIQSSRLSQTYRAQSVMWLDVCVFLEKQESGLMHCISASDNTAGVSNTLQTILNSSKSYLEACRKSAQNQETAPKFLDTLIHQELRAVNTALDHILVHQLHGGMQQSLGRSGAIGAGVTQEPQGKT